MEEILTWTVVQFVDDATVEAVPSQWIQGEFCHWPSFSKSKMVASIKKCEPLNTCWPIHKVKIFRNATYDDYLMARNKAKMAEDTSELNTGDEGTGEKITDNKRKQIQKILSSSDDSSMNESLLSPPPKIKKFKRKVEQVEDKESKNILATNKENEYRPDFNIPQASTSDSRCKNCIENDKHIKTLLQQNHILRSLMTDTLSEIKGIKQTLAQITVTSTQENTDCHVFFKTPGISFPINTDEEFQYLENMLENEENFQNAVKELSKLGGSSSYDHIKRILNLALTNDQTIKYSWLGRKAKRPFQNLNLAKLLIRSVDKAGLQKSQKDTENDIMMWLRRASDRRTSLSKFFYFFFNYKYFLTSECFIFYILLQTSKRHL